MRKRGFTIVELLIVIAVIGVLVTITVIAAKGAMKSSRDKRRQLMQASLQQAITAYYTLNSEWPGPLEDAANRSHDKDEVLLSDSEADKVFQEIVKLPFNGGTMLVDVSGLFVCEKGDCGNSNRGCWDNHEQAGQDWYCGDKNCKNGLDFTDAVKKGARRHIALSNMAFGYQGVKHGKFRRFHIRYNVKTDSVKVTDSETGN